MFIQSSLSEKSTFFQKWSKFFQNELCRKLSKNFFFWKKLSKRIAPHFFQLPKSFQKALKKLSWKLQKQIKKSNKIVHAILITFGMLWGSIFAPFSYPNLIEKHAPNYIDFLINFGGHFPWAPIWLPKTHQKLFQAALGAQATQEAFLGVKGL